MLIDNELTSNNPSRLLEEKNKNSVEKLYK